MTNQDADSVVRVRPRGLLVLLGYLMVQVPLVFLTIFLPHGQSRWAGELLAAIGCTTSVVAVLLVKPERRFGWLLIGVAGFVALGGAVAMRLDVGAAVPAVVAFDTNSLALVAAALLSAIGMAVLGRRTRRSAGLADAMDAAMVIAGLVLVGWMLVDDTAAAELRLAGSVGLPLAAVLLFLFTVKLVLAAGVRLPAVALLVTSSAVLLLMVCLVAATSVTGLVEGRVLRTLSTLHGGLLGAAALHPSIVHATRGVASGNPALPASRLVLLAIAAAVVPTALVLGLIDKPVSFDRSPIGVAIPATAATVVLVSLFGRLALTAHVSQRRATELARRSAALTRALARQDDLRQELAFRATHDPLTGLFNRTVLAERLEWALSHTRRSGLAVLLLMDLDGFKDVNDTYGHPVGDELLATLARRLSSVAPADAVVARLGGDEFAILFDLDSATQARRFAERLAQEVRRPLVVDGAEVVLSASFGLRITESGTAVGTSEILRDADLALYAAKNEGRNRVVTFEPRLRRAAGTYPPQ